MFDQFKFYFHIICVQTAPCICRCTIVAKRPALTNFELLNGNILNVYFGSYSRLQVIDVSVTGWFLSWTSCWRATDPPFDTCMWSSTRFFMPSVLFSLSLAAANSENTHCRSNTTPLWTTGVIGNLKCTTLLIPLHKHRGEHDRRCCATKMFYKTCLSGFIDRTSRESVDSSTELPTVSLEIFLLFPNSGSFLKEKQYSHETSLNIYEFLFEISK